MSFKSIDLSLNSLFAGTIRRSSTLTGGRPGATSPKLSSAVTVNPNPLPAVTVVGDWAETKAAWLHRAYTDVGVLEHASRIELCESHIRVGLENQRATVDAV